MTRRTRLASIGFAAATIAVVGMAFAQPRSTVDKEHQRKVCPKGYTPFLEICIDASTGDVVNPVQAKIK